MWDVDLLDILTVWALRELVNKRDCCYQSRSSYEIVLEKQMCPLARLNCEMTSLFAEYSFSVEEAKSVLFLQRWH